jgi:hypothetical protein
MRLMRKNSEKTVLDNVESKKFFFSFNCKVRVRVKFLIFYAFSTDTKDAKKIQKNDYCAIYPGHKSENQNI